METIILEIINAYGLELLKAVTLAIAGTLGVIAAVLFLRFANTETKQRVARTAVLFAEQVCKDLHGADKMDKAMDLAAKLLKKYGIKFDKEEMKALAEAFLAQVNNAFVKHIEGELLVADGVDVDDLDDDQLRAVLQQVGFAYTDKMTRDEMLAALDEAADQANT